MRQVICDMCGRVVKNRRAVIVSMREFDINPDDNPNYEIYREANKEVCGNCANKIDNLFSTPKMEE